jgi:hypothetical protein
MISLAMRARPISPELLSPLDPNATLTKNYECQWYLKPLHLAATMMSYLHSLSALLLAMGLIGSPRLAQAQLGESPITPGFWSFANRKSETAKDVAATCRNYLEIRFADGHYIGLRIYKNESGVAIREVGEIGRCTFNKETQVEHCERSSTIPMDRYC